MQIVLEILRQRQGERSLLRFAQETGLSAAKLYSYYTGEREAGLAGVRELARCFPRDVEMRAALIAYALGEDGKDEGGRMKAASRGGEQKPINGRNKRRLN